VLTEHTKLALAKVIATFVQLVITAHQAPPYLWSVLQDFTVLTVLNPAFRMHAQLEPIQITQVALQYLAVQNARLVCIATKMDWHIRKETVVPVISVEEAHPFLHHIRATRTT
jgi:hypothetical protein